MLFLTQFDGTHCVMTTRRYEQIGKPDAESHARSPRALTVVSARGLENGHALPSEGCKKCVKRLKNTQTQSTTLSMDWSEAPPGSTGTCRRMLTATSTTTRTALAELPDRFCTVWTHSSLSFATTGVATTTSKKKTVRICLCSIPAKAPSTVCQSATLVHAR